MIPIRDSTRSRSRPYVSIALIAVNVLLYLHHSTFTRQQLLALYWDYAVIPVRYTQGALWWLDPATVFPLFSSMFLHGGWLHLVGNMLYLWVFGDNIEDRMGRAGYFVFYILAGLASNAAHIWANPTSTLPTIGASGAVAGVLGAYLLTFPQARVLALVPLGFFLPMIEVPAVFFLFGWFLLQLLNGVLTLGVASAQTGGVAWWAHIGGFVGGMVLVHWFRDRPRSYRRR
ncbi:MAG TPA: rhomboid family intramembrane serine protease [Clostridiales bacterium UBA8153]|nr:rhomboid family intramembrane serine protease [Clostridiales bacterium UBA8153]